MISSCIPTHITCGFYEPDFEGGNEPCNLKIFSETRSRLEAGGTLFRSIAVGLSTNDIAIESILEGDCSMTINVYYNGTLEETFNAGQSCSSPWSVNAITTLRATINSGSTLIEMPTSDVNGIAWNSIADDSDHLSAFSLTLLTGGNGAPTNPNNYSGGQKVRTGPIYSMIYIDTSEEGSANGSSVDVQLTKYFNGGCWKSFDPLVPDCGPSGACPPSPECP